MPEIAAADLIIRFDDRAWVLQSSNSQSARPLVSARPSALEFAPPFAEARRLPVKSALEAESVAMIVVGFAAEDMGWHLGLLLQPELAMARGGRWCALARWGESEGEAARQAGMALADVIGRPFRLVPRPEPTPAPEAAAAQAERAAPAAPAAQAALPLPEPVRIGLPIDLGDWIVQEDALGLLITRSRAWNRGVLWRGLFYLALAPTFGVLAIGALISRYAPVQPLWLPLLGLAIAVAMLIAAIWQFRARSRGPRVVIDERAQIIRITTASGARVRTQSPFEGVQYVLVSHAIARRQPPAGESGVGGRYHFIAEAWIHAFSPRRGFIELCYVPEVEGVVRAEESFKTARPLSLSEVDSPAHRAGLLVGSMVGVPVYTEER
ncbi:MAG: hypothetical protein IT323_06060 [Anaerolineae bacterium]|nr:hypothetical protein [Anaerolineae bacterium]